MKKVILSVILLLASSAYAASGYQILVGAEYGEEKYKTDDTSSEWEEHIGVRVGVENEESRIYGSYSYSESDLVAPMTYETQTLLLNLEAKTNKHYKFFRIFVGGHLGALYSKYSDTVADLDDTDFIYGAQAGVLMELGKHFSLETGYKYSFTSADDSSINPDRIQAYYGAVNLKF